MFVLQQISMCKGVQPFVILTLESQLVFSSNHIQLPPPVKQHVIGGGILGYPTPCLSLPKLAQVIDCGYILACMSPYPWAILQTYSTESQPQNSSLLGIARLYTRSLLQLIIPEWYAKQAESS